MEWRQHHLIPTNAFHETALRVVSVSKLDDRKICTSAPRDNLMMLTYYNMLSDQIIVTAKYKSQHNNLYTPNLRGFSENLITKRRCAYVKRVKYAVGNHNPSIYIYFLFILLQSVQFHVAL